MNFYNQYLQGIQKKKKKIQHPSPSTQGMHLEEKCRTAELVTTVTVTGSTVSVISNTAQFLSPTSGLLTWRNVFVPLIDRHSALLRLGELNFVTNMLSWIPWQHVWLYRISSIFPQMLHLRLPKKKSFLVEVVWALPQQVCSDDGTIPQKVCSKITWHFCLYRALKRKSAVPIGGQGVHEQVAASWLQK